MKIESKLFLFLSINCKIVYTFTFEKLFLKKLSVNMEIIRISQAGSVACCFKPRFFCMNDSISERSNDQGQPGRDFDFEIMF